MIELRLSRQQESASTNLLVTCHRKLKGAEEGEEVIACYCGELYSSSSDNDGGGEEEEEEEGHKCNLQAKIDKIILIPCAKDCAECKQVEGERIHLSQWENWGEKRGWADCNVCESMCRTEIPKDCWCSWHVDRMGEMRCNECKNIIFDGLYDARDSDYPQDAECPYCEEASS